MRRYSGPKIRSELIPILRALWRGDAVGYRLQIRDGTLIGGPALIVDMPVILAPGAELVVRSRAVQ